MHGESALPSTLELYVNNALRVRQDLPEGPFTVRDVPIVSGDGQIRVVVRDLLGREQVITQSYYASPRLLRAGLHDYSIEAGAVRENFGLTSFDYGRPLLIGTERYGFTDRFTGEIHAELLEDQQTVGIAGGWRVRELGAMSAAVATSRSETGTGGLVSLGFERTAARFSVGVNAEYATEQFARIGLVEGERVPRLKTQLFANVSLGKLGSLSLLTARQQFRPGEGVEGDTQLTSVRHSVEIRNFGYVNLTALRTGGLNSDTYFGVSVSRSLGNRTSGSVSLASDNGGISAYAQMQKGLPAGTGLGYRVRALSGVTDGAEGEVAYQNDVGTYSLGARQIGKVTQTTASLSGGVAVMGAGLFASRALDRSFAIARVGDQPDVRVYRDNQLVGRTNAEGYVILPGLRAYEDNQIRIEQADLPLDVAIESLKMKAVPGVPQRHAARLPDRAFAGRAAHRAAGKRRAPAVTRHRDPRRPERSRSPLECEARSTSAISRTRTACAPRGRAAHASSMPPIRQALIPCPASDRSNAAQPLTRPLALLALLSLPGLASAECSLNVVGLTFGSYDPFSVTDTDITGGVSITCDTDTSAQVSLSAGSGPFAARQLKSGLNALLYNLYADPAHLSIWGDGSPGTRSREVSAAQPVRLPSTAAFRPARTCRSARTVTRLRSLSRSKVASLAGRSNRRLYSGVTGGKRT